MNCIFSLLLLLRVPISETEWRSKAAAHQALMIETLYPISTGDSTTNFKQRQHLVNSHPIYNFLHTYYRYPVSRVLAYSPGSNCKQWQQKFCTIFYNTLHYTNPLGLITFFLAKLFLKELMSRISASERPPY